MFMLQWEKAREKFAALEKENDSFQVFYTYQQAVSGAAVQSCPSACHDTTMTNTTTWSTGVLSRDGRPHRSISSNEPCLQLQVQGEARR